MTFLWQSYQVAVIAMPDASSTTIVMNMILIVHPGTAESGDEVMVKLLVKVSPGLLLKYRCPSLWSYPEGVKGSTRKYARFSVSHK